MPSRIGAGRPLPATVSHAQGDTTGAKDAGAAREVLGGSRPVSRVLSRTAIPLGRTSPHASSDLPGSSAGRTIAPLFGLAPGGVYRAAACCHPRGALLPHLFTLAGVLRRVGGLFSVALSVGSRRPGVTWHPALWSPDFPPRPKAQRLPGRLPNAIVHALTASRRRVPAVRRSEEPLLSPEQRRRHATR
jgi:hypothetical protein